MEPQVWHPGGPLDLLDEGRTPKRKSATKAAGEFPSFCGSSWGSGIGRTALRGALRHL